MKVNDGGFYFSFSLVQGIGIGSHAATVHPGAFIHSISPHGVVLCLRITSSARLLVHTRYIK